MNWMHGRFGVVIVVTVLLGLLGLLSQLAGQLFGRPNIYKCIYTYQQLAGQL